MDAFPSEMAGETQKGLSGAVTRVTATTIYEKAQFLIPYFVRRGTEILDTQVTSPPSLPAQGVPGTAWWMFAIYCSQDNDHDLES